MAFTYFFRDLQTLELLVDVSLPTLCSQAFIRIRELNEQVFPHFETEE